MRMHTDTLNADDIHRALTMAKNAGRIAPSVNLEISAHRSRSHNRAYEIRLSSATKLEGDGRRYGQNGSYAPGSAYAATYDEWGWFIAEIYALESWAKIGPYTDLDQFDWQTRDSYAPSQFGDDIDADRFPYLWAPTKAGRRGTNRLGDDAPRWMADQAAYRPRIADNTRPEGYRLATTAEIDAQRAAEREAETVAAYYAENPGRVVIVATPAN